MKVILLDELRGKGGEGDVVDVAQGFAENYLFPKRLALPATPGNIKQLEERKHNIAKREEARIADAQALADALQDKVVVVDAKIGEEGQLFGSITAAQIADAIEDQLGLTVDRKRIGKSSIKQVGRHPVDINIYREIGATVLVSVGEELEAKAEPEAEVEAEAEVEEAAAEVEETAAEEVAAE